MGGPKVLLWERDGRVRDTEERPEDGHTGTGQGTAFLLLGKWSRGHEPGWQVASGTWRSRAWALYLDPEDYRSCTP